MSEIFRLEKLILHNFKLFGEEFTVRFGDNKLIVFDGPNGHGKTTVFDAIELALTGGIRRLSSTENQQTPGDVVVAHKNKADCFVMLELINNDGQSIVIERRLKTPLTNILKKISNFKQLWDLNLIEDNIRRSIEQTDLNNLVGSPFLERDFTLFHYVEQEETAHFLKKKNERERAEALSVLFGDTVEMREKISKVELVGKRIGQILKQKQQERKALESKGTLTAAQKELESVLSYKPLLVWKEPVFEWDREKVEGLSTEKRDSFLTELYNVGKLVTHRDFFLSSRTRSLVTSQRDVLKAFVAYSGFIGELDALKKLFQQVNLVKRIKSFLNTEGLNDLHASREIEQVFVLVGFENGEAFLKELKQIIDGKARNQDSSKLVVELLGYRAKLEAYLKSQENDKECYLCGKAFDDHSLLINSIDQKEIALKSVLSDDEKRLDRIQSEFIKTTLPVFSDKIDQYLSITELTVSSAKQITELESIKEVAERFEGLRVWLQKEAIDFSDLLLDYKPEGSTEEEIERQSANLIGRIFDDFKVPSDEYNNLNDAVNFENIFKIYFDSNSNYLNSLNVEEVRSKYQYIQQLFWDSISADIKAHRLLGSIIADLEHKKIIVSDLQKKLKFSVGRYQKRLIKDIEVPFYIYSGKVLQTHLSNTGNGIFIKDKTGGEELRNIRFVSNWNNDHDVINTMSSGQIAAVVITLYLTLNKVYSKGLGTLLIDDPVQTMDEINMISLVELLRNEFSDKQIVLSTHEDHVSKYFIYKFLKYRSKVRQVKLLDRKEYQLSH